MFSDRAALRFRAWRLTVGVLLVVGGLGATACGHAVTDNPPSAGMAGNNTSSTRVPGEYIVTLQQEGGAALVQELYADYGVRAVEDLGRGRFLVKLKKDPGLDEVQRVGMVSGKVKAVQPNFVYRSNRL